MIPPKKYLIVIQGPTAIGKTSVAIALARYFSSEIISADSRQFFKEMAIGTAVPSAKELAQIPHHFIHHKSVEDAYNVGDFEQEAIAKINRLFQKQQVLFLVGGSGLYVDAVLNGLDHFPEVDSKIREQLNNEFKEQGIESLQEKLKKLDPLYYEKVDINNVHRIIRALEISMGTGKSFSSFLGKNTTQREFIPIKIGLLADREIIYEKINQRVDQMIASGLIEEAKSLYDKRNLNALQTVGYKELFAYFENEYSLEFAVEEIKKNTRRYAKRQLTWLRKDEEIIWFESPIEISKIIDFIKSKTENYRIS